MMLIYQPEGCWKVCLVPDHTSVAITKTVKVSVHAPTLVTTAVQDKLVEMCQTVWPT